MAAGNSFYVQAFYRGGMNSFEVTPEDGHYNIIHDAQTIARVQFDNEWKQTWGEPLPEDTLVSVFQELQGKQSH